MFEQYASIALILGSVLVAAAVIWLIVKAFRYRLGWGIGCVLFPPTLVVFAARQFALVKRPLALLAVGLALSLGTLAVGKLLSRFPPLGEREKVVAGEIHLTLTGWDKSDYGVIATRPGVVVLQMANPDVTDATLEHLKPLSGLRELDLNGTQITDAGLETLAALPKLEILRLRKTQVTEEGFQKHLRPKESLRELDARDTKISSKSLREWKKEDQEHRKFMK